MNLNAVFRNPVSNNECSQLLAAIDTPLALEYLDLFLENQVDPNVGNITENLSLLFYVAADNLDIRIAMRLLQHRDIKIDGRIIKKLNTTFKVNLYVNEILYTTEIKHELRLMGRKDRLFLCPILCDMNKANLYIAVKYSHSGLHTSADHNTLMQSLQTPIRLNTPGRNVSRGAGSSPSTNTAAEAAAAPACTTQNLYAHKK